MASIRRLDVAGNIYFYSLVAVGVVGLLTPTWYNILPSNFVFEAVLFLCVLVMFKVPKRGVIFFFLASLAYIGVSLFLMMAYNPSDYLDFAQAFKAFIYVAPLCCFYRQGVFERRKALRFLKILLVLFIAKYLYSVLLNVNPRMGSRPGLYVENNFELIFLLLYFFVLADDFGKNLGRWFLVLAAIIVLSGSRSSALALLVVFCGIYLRRLTIRSFFYFVAFIVLIALAAILFASRSGGGGVESIDRYKFMMVFWSEVGGWPWWKYTFGSFPITPLSAESCRTLSYYSRLFSFSEDGSCYSVVLHSYFFRVIFDHGVVGMIFLFGFIAKALHGTGYSAFRIMIFIGVLSASALSVSAMNSVFVSLAIAMAIGLQRPGGSVSPGRDIADLQSNQTT